MSDSQSQDQPGQPTGQFDTYEEHVIVSRTRKFSYGVGGLGIGISDQILETFLMIFYPVIMKVDMVLIGAAMIAPRLLDAITDPLMGWLSDRSRTRWGRRRPYMLFAAPLFGLFIFLMFAPPSGLTDKGLFWYVLAMSALIYTAYTVVEVPYVALGAELSIDYHERTRVQAWRGFIAGFAPIIVSTTYWLVQRPIFPNERVGTAYVVGGFCIALTLMLWVTFLGTREQVEIQAQEQIGVIKALVTTLSNRTFLILAGAAILLVVGLFSGFQLANYVNIYHVFGGTDRDAAARMMFWAGVVSSVFGPLGAWIWGWIGTKTGKKAAYLMCIVALGLIAPLSWILFTPDYPYMQLVYFALFGFVFTGWLVFPAAMVADICDVDEYKTGCRREGSYNGIMGFVIKLAFSLVFIEMGLMMRMAGFDGQLEVQTAETVTGLRLFLALVPLVSSALIFALIWFYPLNEDEVREIRKELDRRRALRERGEHDEEKRDKPDH